MSHFDQPLPAFDFQRVLSDAAQIALLAVKPLALIFGLDALFEFVFTAIVDLLGQGAGLTLIVSFIVIAVYSCAFGTAIRVLHNIGYGHTPDIRRAFDEAVQKFRPLAIVGIGASTATVLGMAALIVPGLWLLGLWAVVFPVMMIENAGMTAFTRSAALTRGYRWQAAGTITITILPVLLAAYLVVSLIAAAPLGGGVVMGAVSTVVDVALSIVLSGALAATTLSIHKRLVELKEGVNPDGIAEIFD